jgi:hypothetical protein
VSAFPARIDSATGLPPLSVTGSGRYRQVAERRVRIERGPVPVGTALDRWRGVDERVDEEDGQNYRQDGDQDGHLPIGRRECASIHRLILAPGLE